MNNPQDYKYIAVWGKMMQSYSPYIKQQQIQAANEGAPLSSIYKDDKRGWQTYDDCVPETKANIDMWLEALK